MRAFAAVALLSATPAIAQAPSAPSPIRLDMAAIAAPAEPDAIPLETGGVPGMSPESWFSDRGQRVVRNVSRATVTPVLPPAGKATGAGVIVLPGGGFAQLSMDNEGWPVARWLAEHGIAAFVVKYRLNPTPASLEGFKAEVLQKIAQAMAGKMDPISLPPQSFADAQAALRLVRTRSATYGVDTRRLGVIGFSAGAITALGVVQAAKGGEMPAFVAPIYGPMEPIAVPADAPPMFTALAADDVLFGRGELGLVSAWRRANKPVELHYFATGGHGYGLGTPGTDTANWIELFRTWLDTQGFLKGAK